MNETDLAEGPVRKKPRLDQSTTERSGIHHSSISYAVQDYTVAWLSALHIERAAVEALLDETHAAPHDFERHAIDSNAYTWGRLGVHKVVIASLVSGQYGVSSAANTAWQLRSSLPHVRIGLLVGIGAAINREDHDIRLGDVVVSTPTATNGGVIQYDLAKMKDGQVERTGVLRKPPEVLLTSLAKLRAQHEWEDSTIPDIMSDMLHRRPRMAREVKGKPGYTYQGAEQDRLFPAAYTHISGSTCDTCDATQQLGRPSRTNTSPEIHYGTIASGNLLIKDANVRDNLAKLDQSCLCFEMEAAGIMDSFPCLVVRGISDYADSHKNDQWQRYAAATAAAFGKEFLTYVDQTALQKTSKLSDVLERIEQLGADLRTTKARVSQLHDTNMTAQIKSWLNAPDASLNYQTASELRHQGTGLWFLNGDLQRWKDTQQTFLWLFGIPGCGKTILSSTIIQSLQHSTVDSDRVILYFYFDFNDNRKHTLDQMLRGLILQLLNNSPTAAAWLRHWYGTSTNNREQPSVKTLKEVFQSLIDETESVYIVLDAIDESSTRLPVLDWVAGFCAIPYHRVQFIITSREENDIKTSIVAWADSSMLIPLRQNFVDADIAAYVSSRLQQDPGFIRWRDRPVEQQLIISRLSTKAGGMFRWATCQLDSLTDCLNRRHLEEVLSSLPETLDATYQRILDNLPKRYKTDAINLLRLIVFSPRALLVHEAVDALAVSANTGMRFDAQDRLADPQEITRLCGGLVTSRMLQYWQVADDVRGTLLAGVDEFEELRLAHFSVKEYFISRLTDTTQYDSFDERTCVKYLAKTCLGYLLSLPDQGQPSTVLRQYPFTSYAAHNWQRCAAVCRDDPDIEHMVAMLLTRSRSWGQSRLRFALACYDPYRLGNELESTEPIHLACLYGAKTKVKNLLKAGCDTRVTFGSTGQTALQMASEQGHTSIVRMLIDHDKAACNDTWPWLGKGHYGKGNTFMISDYQQALIAACRAGEYAITVMLLETGIDIGGVLLDGESALQAACHNGHYNVVSLLLSHGVDVNAALGKNGTALETAVAFGRTSIAKMLLEHNADVNADEGSALQAACTRGDRAMVQLLLDRGADVNRQGGRSQNALLAACEARVGNTSAIVQLLLDHGADPTLYQDRILSPQTALAAICSRARAHNHAEIVSIARMLLDAGANAHDVKALLAAKSSNCHQLVDMLWEYMDPNGGDDRLGMTILHRLAMLDQDQEIETAHNYQFDINRVDAQGWTPMHWAARMDAGRAVESLMRCYADITSTDKQGWTPYVVVRYCNHAIFRRLEGLRTGRTTPPCIFDKSGYRSERCMGCYKDCRQEIWCQADAVMSRHLCFRCVRDAALLYPGKTFVPRCTTLEEYPEDDNDEDFYALLEEEYIQEREEEEWRRSLPPVESPPAELVSTTPYDSYYEDENRSYRTGDSQRHSMSDWSNS